MLRLSLSVSSRSARRFVSAVFGPFLAISANERAWKQVLPIAAHTGASGIAAALPILFGVVLGFGATAGLEAQSITGLPVDYQPSPIQQQLTPVQQMGLSGPELLEISNNCYKTSHTTSEYKDCVYNAINSKALHNYLYPQSKASGSMVRRVAGIRAQAAEGSAATFAPVLSSSSPDLPFLGNPLTVLGFVPNAATADNVTAAYLTGLRRQSDCSLDEDYILPDQSTPAAEYLTSLAGAQDYFHQLAGLATTPDVFAGGCVNQVLGLPASTTVEVAGETPDGAAVDAQLASAGLYVTITDLTANTFTSHQLTSGSDPGAFSTASLRNNGTIDLVETGLTDPANSKPATAVLLGNGDGTFQAPVYYDVSANSYALPAGFTVDDVTGDGIPDIVILNSTNTTYGSPNTLTGTVTTLIGKGDGTFTIGPVSNLTWTSSLEVLSGIFKTGDVKDLLVGGTVLFGSGTGSFTQGPTNSALAVQMQIASAVGSNALGYLRNNGILDVVVSVPGYVSIFYGNGDGTFQIGPNYAALPDSMPVTITDIDGDGNFDIVLGGSSENVYTVGGYDMPIPMYQILMGRGDGTFVDSPTYLQGTYGGDKRIAGADFNGDGKTDVLAFNESTGAVGSLPNSLLMLPGDGTGALGAAVTSDINLAPTMVVAAKMNHDPLADAVVAGSGNSGPELAVLTNQGNGTFAGEQDYSLANVAVSLVVGDFNGDGIPDVAVGESGMGVFVLFGQSNGTLGSPVQVDSSANPTGLAAGSLTTDGRTDLVVADQVTGALHIYLGNANGTFTAGTVPTGATGAILAALGDLNNDGKLDLIVAGFIPGSSGNPNVTNVYTLLGNGDGTFQAANTLALASNDAAPASLALADFNNDKDVDVAIGNSDDYTEVLLSNGDGTLTETALALGQRPASIAAADLLGNGYPEILVGNGDTQGQGYSLTVFQNQPTGWTAATTTITPTVSVSASPSSITAAQSTSVTITVSGGSGNATPTGSVTLTSGTYTSAATTLSSGSAVIGVSGSLLAVATDTLTATYTPDSSSSSVYNGATGTGSVTVTTAAPAITPTVSVSPSPSSITTAQSTSVTVAVSGGSGNPTPTGSVTLTSGSYTSAATTLSNGSAAITVPAGSLAAGTDTLTATYMPDTTSSSVYNSATGTGSVTVTTVMPGFALSNSGNITVSPGATTGNTSTISVTPSGGFTGAVALTCAVTPTAASDPATCALSPASVTISGTAAQTSTLSITTTAATAASLDHSSPGKDPWYAAGGFSLACAFLFIIPTRRRRLGKMLGIALLFGITGLGIVSCGGGGGSKNGGGGGTGNPGTTAGAYTVTVTGTAGSTTQTTTVNLTVN